MKRCSISPRQGLSLDRACGAVGILLGLLCQVVQWVFIAVIGLILIIAAFILPFIFWRCPACRRWLPTFRTWDLSCCPYCRERID
ncbi:hypothetical protein D1159_09100 [Pseudoflavonifractor sp. 524-17]|uniref:hypothetical protein n=1 Tax=Pseudoflavonifractor sp. 524-17 TaxID=2304577 RepID=UPI00137B2EA6|nr:hypothetical protein [Pseudoflavonifractor sp. 524-17]NCE64740.1 hypothetical protein [Pseudoflavonifractor sp. 524-17]